MGVAGLPGDPSYPAHEPTMPPVPLGKIGKRYAQATNKLGWHWWPSEVAINTVEYDGRAPCINLGNCTPGCAQGAKASVDITYWPQAIRADVELRTNCRVREILTNEEGMASGVVYYDPDGVERFQPAEVVVLAANRVGMPRLLLNSASERFPNGLANSSGMVGKNLMLHPWPQVWGYVDEEVDGDRGPQTLMWGKEFYETDRTRGFVRDYTFQYARGTGPVNEAVISMATGGLPWGPDHHRVYRTLYQRRLQIGIACEDLPEEHNRVTLDPVLKDSHGIPAPKIDYTISENTKAMMEHGIARDQNPGGDWGEEHRRLTDGTELSGAPAGNRADGYGPVTVGGERVGAEPRCEELVHRGWFDLGDFWRCESDFHYSGAGAVYRGPDEATPGEPVRLIGDGAFALPGAAELFWLGIPALPPGQARRSGRERLSIVLFGKDKRTGCPGRMPGQRAGRRAGISRGCGKKERAVKPASPGSVGGGFRGFGG